MERRLAEIPTEEWGDVQVDITPREYVLDYLAHGFPTQLFEPFTDERRQSVVAAGLSRRPAGAMPRGRGTPRPHDRAAGLARPGPGRARPDRAAVRHRHGGRGHRPLAAHRAQARHRRCRPPCGREPAPDRPIWPRRRPSWTTRSAFWCSPTPAAPGAATMPTSRPRTSGCGCTICWRPAGRPTPPSRVLAAPTAPTRRSRRCSGRSRPTSRPRSGSCPRSPAGSTRLGAITKGQRQTGGQGLFRADDNLESVYGRAALRQLYVLIYSGKVEGCSLADVRGRDRAAADRPGRQLCARTCRRSRPSSTGCWR